MKNRRFLAALLSVCMLLILLPTGAFAADGDVAKVGDKTYSTLAQAVEEIQDGQVLELLDSVELDKALTIDKSITIQGGGNTITATDPNSTGLTFTGANMEVKDLNIVATVGNTSAVKIQGPEGQKVTFTSCTIENQQNGNGIWSNVKNGVITLDHSTVRTDANKAWGQAITLHPNAEGITVNVINDSLVSSKYYYGIISFAPNGHIYVEDSTVSAWGALYLKKDFGTGKTAGGTTIDLVNAQILGECPHGYGSTNSFAAVVLENVDDVTINQDKDSVIAFKGNENYMAALSVSGTGHVANLNGTVRNEDPAISPDFFSFDPDSEIAINADNATFQADQATAPLFVETKPDGTVANVANDASALQWVGDGNTVTFYSDATQSMTIAANNVTVNGNGFSIKAPGAETALTLSGNNITLNQVNAQSEQGIALIVKDGATGTVINGGTFATYTAQDDSDHGRQGEGAMRFEGNNGDITVTGATLRGGLHVLNYTSGKLNLTGNTIGFDYTGDVALVGILVHMSNGDVQLETSAAGLIANNNISVPNANSLYAQVAYSNDQGAWITQEEVVAKTNGAAIGDTYYGDLRTALAAAKDGDTIRLLADNQEKILLDRELTFTLDLNGFAFTGSITGAEGWTVSSQEGADGTITYTVTKATPTDPEEKPEENPEENPGTGDAAGLSLFAALAVLSAAAVVLMSRKRAE